MFSSLLFEPSLRCSVFTRETGFYASISQPRLGIPTGIVGIGGDDHLTRRILEGEM